jgi:hypothetical protein
MRPSLFNRAVVITQNLFQVPVIEDEEVGPQKSPHPLRTHRSAEALAFVAARRVRTALIASRGKHAIKDCRKPGIAVMQEKA